MKLFTCTKWVPQNVVAVSQPCKVRLSKTEVATMLRRGEEGEGIDHETDSDGSTDGEGAEEVDKPYKMDDYDEEEEEETLRRTDDEDGSSDDDEDFKLRPGDNLLLCGKVLKEECGINVYVFNGAAGDLYVHHDYTVQQPVTYDPGSSRSLGNLCAVGTMSSCVEVWDVDMVDAVAPAVILGEGKEENVKHSDAVLDLAWNANMEHVLASGSADGTIVLWDLEAAEGHTRLGKRGGREVQSIEFHLKEESILCSGDLGGQCSVWDGRTTRRASTFGVGADVQIERCVWNRENGFTLLVTTDVGGLHCVDIRHVDKPVWSVADAHEEAVCGIAQSCTQPQCLVTGAEQLIVWKLESTIAPQRVADLDVHLGEIHAIALSPDHPFVVAVVGEKGEYVKVIDLSSNEATKHAIVSHFSN